MSDYDTALNMLRALLQSTGETSLLWALDKLRADRDRLEARVEELEEAAADFLEQDHLSQHVIEGWWGLERHVQAREQLERALEGSERREHI